MTIKLQGFTLIELVIATAIVGILASIAYPNYIESIRKSKRSDAKAALVSFSNAMEIYKMQHGNSYLNSGNPSDTNKPPKSSVFPAVVPISGGTKTYDLRLTVTAADLTTTPPTPESYTLSAVPVDAADTCGTLAITNLGAKTPTTAGCW